MDERRPSLTKVWETLASAWCSILIAGGGVPLWRFLDILFSARRLGEGVGPGLSMLTGRALDGGVGGITSMRENRPLCGLEKMEPPLNHGRGLTSGLATVETGRGIAAATSSSMVDKLVEKKRLIWRMPNRRYVDVGGQLLADRLALIL
jgi:hypothetical protein